MFRLEQEERVRRPPCCNGLKHWRSNCYVDLVERAYFYLAREGKAALDFRFWVSHVIMHSDDGIDGGPGKKHIQIKSRG